MRKRVGKAIYVFMCSLMGMLLFAIFHRSLIVIYYILLNSNFELYSFGIRETTMRALDFFTLLLALFFGGWYGTALGLHWYRLVYEGPVRVGLLHGFVPHQWRKTHLPHPESHAPAKAVRTTPSKIVHVQQHTQSHIQAPVQQHRKMDGVNVFAQLEKMAPPGMMPWDFDDEEFTKKPTPVKKTTKRKPRAAAVPKEKEVKAAKPRKVVARKRTAKVKQTQTVTESEAV